jgi:hypothetical protein
MMAWAPLPTGLADTIEKGEDMLVFLNFSRLFSIKVAALSLIPLSRVFVVGKSIWSSGYLEPVFKFFKNHQTNSKKIYSCSKQ